MNSHFQSHKEFSYTTSVLSSRVRKDILRLLQISVLPSAYIGRQSEIEAAGVSEHVYWIPADIMRAPAKATVFNTIRLNENLTERYPQDVVEYIFLHERGHAARSRINLVWFLLGTTLTFLAAGVSVGFVVVFGLFAATNPIPQVIGLLVLSLCLSTVFSWLFCRVKFKEELRAERYALNQLGEDEFRRRSETYEEIVDRSRYDRLKRRLFYPSVDT